MNYVDIAIIGIIVLFALIGILKGIGKTFIKFVCFALSLLAAYLLTGIVVKFLLGIDFLGGFIVGERASLASLYQKSFNETLASADATTKVGGILGSYVNPMIARYTEMGGVAEWGMSYARFIAVNMSIHSLNVIVCILLYVLIRLVMILVAALLKKIIIREGKHPKAASRLLGFIFGAVRGGIIIVALLIMVTVIIPFGFARPVVNTADKSLIGDFAAEYSYKAVDAIVYGKDADDTEKMLGWAGIKPASDPLPDDGGETGGEVTETPDDGGEAGGEVTETPDDGGEAGGGEIETPDDGGETGGDEIENPDDENGTGEEI